MPETEVRTLRFEGLVKKTSYNPDRVEVGGHSVLGEIQEKTNYRTMEMIVQIEKKGATHIFEGKGDIDPGMEGYSSLTPGENSYFYVGEEDLLERLIDLEGEEIVLTVALGKEVKE